MYFDYIYRITPFLFLRLCPEFVYFPINAFFFLYIGNRHFFFLGSPPESIPIYIFFCTLPIFLIYSYFSIGGFLYIWNNPFLFFVLPRLIAISLYIVNFCILPRLIYSIRDIPFLFIYFAQNLGVFLFRLL